MQSPLTQTQVVSFKQALSERQDFLLKELNEEKAPPTPMESESQDYESNYVEDLEQKVASELDDQHRVELQNIEAALQRIKSRHYGICIDCNGDIGIARLTAYPAAKRCLECKQVVEQKRANN